HVLHGPLRRRSRFAGSASRVNRRNPAGRGGGMQLHVKGKNLEVSDSIRAYAEKKLAKLDKQVYPTTRVEVELAVEKNPSVSATQIAEATVWLKGHTLGAREATRDMKASIDELAEKLVRQVHDERDKKVRKRKIDKPSLDARGMPENL